jgi:hypothetical protein
VQAGASDVAPRPCRAFRIDKRIPAVLGTKGARGVAVSGSLRKKKKLERALVYDDEVPALAELLVFGGGDHFGAVGFGDLFFGDR